MAQAAGLGRGAVARPARRWPWALAATVAGAAAGAAVAGAARRGQDRAGAVDPQQVQAVVDRPDGTAPRGEVRG